jgi:hypothetical protein
MREGKGGKSPSFPFNTLTTAISTVSAALSSPITDVSSSLLATDACPSFTSGPLAGEAGLADDFVEFSLILCSFPISIENSLDLDDDEAKPVMSTVETRRLDGELEGPLLFECAEFLRLKLLEPEAGITDDWRRFGADLAGSRGATNVLFRL